MKILGVSRLSNGFRIFALIQFLMSLEVLSECPNACSSHGICGQFDVCHCYHNWFRNDCSERVCPYGTAIIDIPKGDLNMDGIVSGPDVTIVERDQIWKKGTQEMYPQFKTAGPNGVLIENTAHELSECSNKGFCDRKMGICKCLPGYEGASCNRVSCPRDAITDKICSGHGTCNTATEIASQENENNYFLWDKDTSMGCTCDDNYYGIACENRKCKTGMDPFYYNEHDSRRYSNWTVLIMTNQHGAEITGEYYIYFYDYTGRGLRTDAIPYGADCDTLTYKLETLPGSAIPRGSVRCLMWTNFDDSDIIRDNVLNGWYGIKYILTFPSNPGYLKPLSFSVNEGTQRPELFHDKAAHNVSPRLVSYPDGFRGENTEYFTSKCIGVDVTIKRFYNERTKEDYYYLDSMTSIERRLLSRCLGDADGDEDTYDQTSSVLGGSFTWDFGTVQNPHILRLVDLTENQITDLCTGSHNSVRQQSANESKLCSYSEDDTYSSSAPYQWEDLNIKPRSPGFFVPLIFDPVSDRFKIFTRAGQDFDESTKFQPWATSGYFQIASESASLFSFRETPYSNLVYTANSSSVYAPNYFGNLDCETNAGNENGVLQCLEKGDRIMIFDPSFNEGAMNANPKYPNFYEILKIGTQPSAFQTDSQFTTAFRITLDAGLNAHYVDSINRARVYVFYPPAGPQQGYRVVSECANRGLCDTDTGLCSCFDGYVGDSCNHVQESWTADQAD